MMAKVARLAWPVSLLVLGALVPATAWHRWTVSLLFVLVAALPLLLLRGAIRVGLSRWFASSMLVLLSVMAAYLATTGAGLTLEQTVQDVVPRLLTAPQPYAARADLLVGPLLLTALVSVLVGLRLESRLKVEPVAGGAALYLVGMLLTAGTADPWGIVAVLMLVVALLGWVFLDHHAEPVSGRLALAGPVAVIGAGLLAAIATLPVASAFEPRDRVEPPTVDVVASNPMTQLGAWATNEDTPLLQVRGPAVPLRLVVLDDYDGVQWTASTRYEQLPDDGRTGLGAGAYRQDSTVQVQFRELGGNWLPSPGTPTSIALPDALLDPGTGTLYAPDGTAGLTYEVSGVFDSPPDQALATARLPDDGRYTDLPPLPDPLREYARRVGDRGATPFERAVAIEDQVRRSYELSPTGRSGSALWRLEEFLLGGRKTPGGGVGTSEQFASAFAVLARANGLPTRVVVGFGPGEEQDDGTRVIAGGDALAWAEVYFADLGWVPFSPTPDDETFAPRSPVEAERAELPGPAETGTPSATPSTETERPGDPLPTEAGAAADEARPPSDGAVGGADPAVLAGLALAAAVALLVLLRTGRRLQHRRQGTAGVWFEIGDPLRLAGLRPALNDPADVVAADADARLGITSATPVAARAEASAFGPPAGATSGRSPGGAVPAELRRHVGVVRRTARRSLPLWRRWWFWLDPRVLTRR
ncbi:hypothetical protein GCM10023340_38070 [Nocardioides marinquilinus]|uniref:Transglutaminase-like domain-containing protein n=1 Tax=Nocardioides marinquilinus TaxID=1210400 RepID=A0ABP9PYZ5_9ACTN